MDDLEWTGGERRASEIGRLKATARLVVAVEELAKHYEEHQKAISDVREQLVRLKLSNQKNTLHHKSFMKTWDRIIKEYDQTHNDHEKRIRDLFAHPCKHEKRIDILENENKEQDKKIYKILGFFSVLTLIVTFMVQWLMKKLTGG